MLERVDRVTSPLVKGQFYLVPTVTMAWLCNGQIKAWPVIGHEHSDQEFFRFDMQHYHVDVRFVTPRYRKDAFRSPLHLKRTILAYTPPVLPSVVWRQRKCQEPLVWYPHGDQPAVKDVRKHYAGHQCVKGKGGWICPHRGTSLGSITPIAGVITCPLHGLNIDAETGIVRPQK